MKLLESLKRHPVDNCVILTYNADLLFFEYLLFEPLYGAECRNTLVICDPIQYQEVLADASHLRFAGQRYWLLPGLTSTSGAFHPKMILLTSADRGRLFMTSGNLTKAGYTHNWEVATLFEFQAKHPELQAWQACQWAVDLIRQIMQTSKAAAGATDRLEQLIGTTPWLRQEPPVSETGQLWLLHNLGQSLLDQVYDQYRRLDASPVVEAIVVSPYFDRGSRAAVEVRRRFQPQRWRIFTQGDGPGLSPHTLAAAIDPSDHSLELYGLDINDRALHAKTLLLRSRQGAWLVTGSANFSAPALLYPAAAGNTEAVSLRFEPDPAYFDSWLADLTRYGVPIALASLPEPATADLPVSAPQPQIKLMGVTLSKGVLRLQFAELLASEASITLHLHQASIRSLALSDWRQDADLAIWYPLDLALSSELEHPTLASVEVVVNGDVQYSNRSLLHHTDALQRFGRPVVRRDRPRIPDGLQPEDDEHAILLMEMLHELLATNSQLLRRHQGRIAAGGEQEQQEAQMALEDAEDYDPQAHFVEELVRTGAGGSGASLYADYFDQLTYEDLLRAALSAVRPLMPPQDGDRNGASPDKRSQRGDSDRSHPDAAAIRARAVERVRHGMRRLVESFQQGVGENDYLTLVPPTYLAELYVIITTYLREVWRQEILPGDLFVEYSLTMLKSFWGHVGVPSAWEGVRTRLSETEIRAQEERLNLSAQTWFHAFVLAKLMEQSYPQRLNNLAAWMRRFASCFSAPEILYDLSEAASLQLLRLNLPADWPRYEVNEMVDCLTDVMPRYDESTLLEEVANWPGTRVTLEPKKIAGLTRVPTIEINTPLSFDRLDECVRVFATFVAWPAPKAAAWARFTNTNPPIHATDIQSVRLFHRSDRKWLLFATEYASGEFSELEKGGVDVNNLQSVSSLAHLKAL